MIDMEHQGCDNLVLHAMKVKEVASDIEENYCVLEKEQNRKKECERERVFEEGEKEKDEPALSGSLFSPIPQTKTPLLTLPNPGTPGTPCTLITAHAYLAASTSSPTSTLSSPTYISCSPPSPPSPSSVCPSSECVSPVYPALASEPVDVSGPNNLSLLFVPVPVKEPVHEKEPVTEKDPEPVKEPVLTRQFSVGTGCKKMWAIHTAAEAEAEAAEKDLYDSTPVGIGPMMTRRVVIGVCGPSTSGKTTIANKLGRKIAGATVIHADELFLDVDYKQDVFGVPAPDLNDPRRYDWEEVCQRVEAVREGLVVVESYLLLYSEQLVALLDGVVIVGYENTEAHRTVAMRRFVTREMRKDPATLVVDLDPAHKLQSMENFMALYYWEIMWKCLMGENKYMWDGSRLTMAKEKILTLEGTGDRGKNFAESYDFVTEIIARCD